MPGLSPKGASRLNKNKQLLLLRNLVMHAPHAALVKMGC